MFDMFETCFAAVDGMAGAKCLELHPILAQSADTVTREAHADAQARSISVPGQTFALFVEPR